jgi:hypothetical protein
MKTFKSKEKPVIEFISRYRFLKDIEEIQPRPAQKFIPEWWKKAPWDESMNESRYRPEGLLVKQCPMFPEFFSSGYILPMWADTTLFFKNNEWHARCGHVESPFIIDIFLNDQFLKHSEYKFNGFNANAVFQFHNPWKIKTTKGYSVFQLPLFYHFNNDFSVLPGTYDANIVDTNKLEVAYFGNEKEIFIKRGTPLVQYIPYKKERIDYLVRDSNKDDEDHFLKNKINKVTTFKNFYAQNRHRG